MTNKTVVIHQPDFVPYLGFFDRFLQSDLYVVLDHVQYVAGSRGWTHRDKIKTPQGAKWVSISVKKAPRYTAIKDIELSTATDWKDSNLRLLDSNYKKASFFSEIMPRIENLYQHNCTHLAEFNLLSIEMLMDMLDIRIPMVLSSTLDPETNKSELMAELCAKTQATHYMSGTGARDYHNQEPFDRAGVEVIWQDFTHPVYPQLYGDFEPYLSSLDVLFNCGIETSRQIIRNKVLEEVN